MKKRVTFIHNQYNSPLGLYSPAEVAETLGRHTRLLANGAVGIDFGLLSVPNLAQSEVYKLLHEEQLERRPPWQKEQQQMASANPDMKRVAWPPTAPGAGSFEVTETNENDTIGATAKTVQQQANKVAPPVAPKPSRDVINAQIGSDGTEMATREVTEAFASNELIGERQLIAKPPPPAGLLLVGRPLKQEAPFTQEPNAVYASQPAFKRGVPAARKLGDMVWPPKSTTAAGASDVGEPEEGRVKRQYKDYRGFFGQHQLPANFPMYRAPPGTQHFGLADGENTTAM